MTQNIIRKAINDVVMVTFDSADERDAFIGQLTDGFGENYCHVTPARVDSPAGGDKYDWTNIHVRLDDDIYHHEGEDE